jgi:2-polyprenyl-3-methyl-5-hydroxy-6-metoxy-1,4-benzoquinol methylase
MEWSESPDYLEELEKFLAPLRNTVFWDSCWHAYTDVGRFNATIDLLRLYTMIEGKRILDSGCGTAGLLITLQQAGAAELVGIEVDPNVYRLATLRTSRLPQIRIIQDDAALLTQGPESFDIVISSEVIEHVTDYRAYLHTQARLLKPGGVLLITCPNRLWPYEAHSILPLIQYLPRPLSKAICRCVEHATFLPRPLRDRGRTSTLYETDFTYFRLKRLLLRNDFEVLEMNHPRYLMAELFAHDLPGVARALQNLPLRWQWRAAVFFSKALTAVCRKVALRESPTT